MKGKILLTLVVVALGIAMTSTTVAQTSEASTVNVSVNQEVSVNVAPENFVYTNDPGTFNSTSKNQYTGVEIENTGSRNISDVWLDSSDPGDNPFGTGSASQYDAGNFIQVKPTSEISGLTDVPSGDNYAHISRKDFNESNDLSYFKEPTEVNKVRYGRFRFSNESFFWAVDNVESGGTPNGCDGSASTSSQLYVGKNPHSEVKTGSVDFTDASNYDTYSLSATSGSYGRADSVTFNTYEGNIDMSVFTWCGNGNDASSDNSTHIYGSRWGMNKINDTGQYSASTNSLEYILQAANDGEEMQAGEHFTVETRVAVPNAVSQGDVTQGDLTVYVSDANV